MRNWSGRRGSALIEFAVALAMLAPVFTYGMLYLMSFYWMHELVDGVRRGADVAMRTPEEAEVRKAVLSAGVPGLKEENVRIDWDERRVTVSIVGYGLKAPGGEVRLEGRPRATMPRLEPRSAHASTRLGPHTDRRRLGRRWGDKRIPVPGGGKPLHPPARRGHLP